MKLVRSSTKTGNFGNRYKRIENLTEYDIIIISEK